MRLTGTGVIVTGATGGIGDRLVATLLARGASVIAVGRREARLQALRQRHESAPMAAVAADLTVAADRDRLCAIVRGFSPSVSVLLHAAAVAEFGVFEQLAPAALERMLQTNLLAPMLLTRQLLPMLSERPQAQVAVLGSTFGNIGFPGFAGYCAGKFGLRGWIEALAREHAGGPVHFSWLAPRATRTGFNGALVDAMNAELGIASDAPEDVAEWICRELENDRRRAQYGWPEKLFARLNGAVPWLVDRVLARQLPVILRHARSAPAAAASLNLGE